MKVLYVTSTRYDYTTATLVQGLNALPGIELRTTTLGNYARTTQVLQREDARAFGRSAALLILGYNRGVDTELYWAIDNPGAVRTFVDGGDNAEMPLSLEHARAMHAIFKREYLRPDHSLRNLIALLTRRSAGLWKTARRHSLMPFPSFEGFRNRTRPIDVLRNIAARSIEHKVYPFPYGIEDRFVGSLNPAPRFELSCMLNPQAPERADFVRRLRDLRLPAAFTEQIPIGPDDVQRLVSVGAVNPTAMRPVELGHNAAYYEQIRTAAAVSACRVPASTPCASGRSSRRAHSSSRNASPSRCLTRSWKARTTSDLTRSTSCASCCTTAIATPRGPTPSAALVTRLRCALTRPGRERCTCSAHCARAVCSIQSTAPAMKRRDHAPTRSRPLFPNSNSESVRGQDR